jgi:hypothetical protein
MKAIFSFLITECEDAMTKKHDLNERAIAVAAEGPSVHTPRQGSSVRVWPKTPTKKGRRKSKIANVLTRR